MSVAHNALYLMIFGYYWWVNLAWSHHKPFLLVSSCCIFPIFVPSLLSVGRCRRGQARLDLTRLYWKCGSSIPQRSKVRKRFIGAGWAARTDIWMGDHGGLNTHPPVLKDWRQVLLVSCTLCFGFLKEINKASDSLAPPKGPNRRYVEETGADNWSLSSTEYPKVIKADTLPTFFYQMHDY